MRIEGFGNGAADGKFELVASVDGVSVGDGATDANLRKILIVEGAEELGTGTFSSDSVEVSTAEPENGRVKFTLAPKGEKPAKFFFKVKMK